MSGKHRLTVARKVPAAPARLEPLEARTLFSTAVMGYLQDWKIASGAANYPMFAETSTTNGTISSDQLNWADLTQVNYFSLRPNADGSLQTLSNGDIESASGEDANIQLPPIVAEAHAKNPAVKVFVTVGGGDGTSITDMTALVDANQTAWTNFATHMQSFVSTYGLSGVDLDWEPVSATRTELDNFGTLVATLKGDGLTVTAAALSDPIAITGTGQSAFVFNNVAVQNLSAIDLMAYPSSSETQADGYVAQWATYLNGGTDVDGTAVHASVSKLNYGIDDIDDTYNTAAVVKGKVDTTLAAGYGGLFVWDLDGDTNSTVVDSIASELAANGGGGVVTPPIEVAGIISGKVETAAGTGIAGVTVFVDSNSDGVPDDGETSAVTDASGDYTLQNIAIGTPNPLAQVLPTGYTQVTGAGTVTLTTSGQALANQDFIDQATTPTSPTGPVVTTPTLPLNTSPLTAAIKQSTLPVSVVSGSTLHSKVLVTIDNPTAAAMRGSMKVTVYASPDGSIDGNSIPLGSLSGKRAILAGKSAMVSVPVTSIPASLKGSYSLIAVLTDVNQNFAIATGPSIAAAAPDVAFSETIISSTLAAADVSGAKTRASVRLKITNNGNVAGAGELAIDLSPDGTATDGTLIRSLHEPALKPGASRTVTLPLQALPAVTAGTYSLVATMTDAAGDVTTASSSQTYQLAAPFVSLAPSDVVLTTTAAGGSLSFTLTNSGNIVSGPSTLTVDNIVSNTLIANVLSGHLASVPPGKARNFHERLTAREVTLMKSGSADDVLEVTDSNGASQSVNFTG